MRSEHMNPQPGVQLLGSRLPTGLAGTRATRGLVGLGGIGILTLMRRPLQPVRPQPIGTKRGCGRRSRGGRPIHRVKSWTGEPVMNAFPTQTSIRSCIPHNTRILGARAG